MKQIEKIGFYEFANRKEFILTGLAEIPRNGLLFIEGERRTASLVKPGSSDVRRRSPG